MVFAIAEFVVKAGEESNTAARELLLLAGISITAELIVKSNYLRTPDKFVVLVFSVKEKDGMIKKLVVFLNHTSKIVLIDREISLFLKYF